MKKFLLAFFFALPLLSAAQFPFPFPLTDSLTDNRNPDFMIINVNEALMVWERSDSPDSTAIYSKVIYPSGVVDPTIVKIAGKSGVHYTNPKLVYAHNNTWPQHDTLFYIFFQSDENGNKDIMYVKYTNSGNVYGPFPLAVSNEDEEQFSVSDSYDFDAFGLTWKQQDKIMSCFGHWNNNLGQYLFSGPVIIDTGDVANPVFDNVGTHIMWEKQWNGETKVAYSSYNNLSSSWSAPVIMNKPGNNEQISRVEGLWAMDLGSFTWRSRVGNQTYLFEYYFDQFPDSSQTISNFDVRYPTCALTPIIVKNSQDFNNFFVVYSSDSTGNREIFSNWFFFGSQNLSDNNVLDDKPQIFLLQQFGWSVYEIVVSWESFRNGHWQLYYTFFDMTGGVNPLSGNGIQVSCHPNPVKDNLTINYTVSSHQPIDIRIFNSLGMKVFEETGINSVEGANQYILGNNGNTPFFNKPGIYYVEVKGKDGRARIKVVKL